MSVPQQPPTTSSGRKVAPEGDVPLGEVGQIARVELLGLVEFGVAESGGVGTQPVDPLPRVAFG